MPLRSVQSGQTGVEKMTQENEPPPPDDWYSVGWQHYLIGKHTPDRLGTMYPTQDRHPPEAEIRFTAGWNAAKLADDLLKDADESAFD